MRGKSTYTIVGWFPQNLCNKQIMQYGGKQCGWFYCKCMVKVITNTILQSNNEKNCDGKQKKAKHELAIQRDNTNN